MRHQLKDRTKAFGLKVNAMVRKIRSERSTGNNRHTNNPRLKCESGMEEQQAVCNMHFPTFAFRVSIFILEIPSLPCLDKIGPGSWVEDILRGHLSLVNSAVGNFIKLHPCSFTTIAGNGAH